MRIPLAATKSELTKTTPNGTLIHDLVEDMPGLMLGPFARLPSGEILGVDGNAAQVSADGGRSWRPHDMFAPDFGLDVSSERAVIVTRSGTLILAFMKNICPA